MKAKLKSLMDKNHQFDISTHKFVMHEVGCAVGNTIFPLSKKYSDILKIYGYDFSPRAIQMIKDNPEYDLSKMEAAVVDLVNDPVPPHFPVADYVTCIFIISAIDPEHHFDCLTK